LKLLLPFGWIGASTPFIGQMLEHALKP